jgi:hypothetical protein
VTASIDDLLTGLESAPRSAAGSAAVLALLDALEERSISDAPQLARLHDDLLFLCAYPATPRILKRAEAMLKPFAQRVAAIEDQTALLDPQVSGIAGTPVEIIVSYDLLRWLAARFPRQLEIEWSEPPNPERLAALLTLLVPFLEEEASADANVPYLAWLEAAGATSSDGGLAWLLRHLAAVPLPPSQRAALYDALGLWIRWSLGNSRFTRTLMRRPPHAIFHQEAALLGRRDVSIARELAAPPLRITKLSAEEGEVALDMARATLLVRYRELYCFTWGDPATVLSVDAGRGLEILVVGILPEKRLPLRAGFAPLILRNGIPIGYGDAFAVCERMEVSLNIFYAFRGGESAYCLAMLMKMYHQLFGSTAFTIDPYQIGMDNAEAIEAGAFWFYRKLGFRSTDPAIEQLASREEERMAKKPGHRTSTRTLEAMARSALIWEQTPTGDWDRFHIRNLGLAVQRAFAAGGQTRAEFEESAASAVARELSLDRRKFSAEQRRTLERLAPLLRLIPNLGQWSEEEKEALREILRSKTGKREATYLQRLTAHAKLRRALIELGS